MEPEPRTLVVTGEGVAHGTPNRCVVHLALNVMADTASDALDRLADLASRAVQAMLDQGLQRRDVQTSNLSLNDFFDREKQRVTARVAGYSMTVRTRSVEEVGPVLAALSEVAGDLLQVQRLQLEVSDYEALRASARRDAVVDAAARARQLAEAAGVTLGRILEITEGQLPRGGRPVRFAAAMATSAGGAQAMPIEPGEVTSTIAVTVTYALAE